MKIARLAAPLVVLFFLTSSGTASAADGNEPAPESAPATTEPATNEPATNAPTTNAPTTNAPATGEGAAAVSPSGLSLGLRVGFGLPLGQSSEGIDLSKSLSGSVPFIFDIGYRGLGAPHIYLGAFGTWGPAFANNCPAPSSCSASVARFGINVRFHLLPQNDIDPYLGLGAGYELLFVSEEANGKKASGSLKGFEFLELQGGLDFKPTPAFRVGPFVNLAMGQYASGEVTDVNGKTTSADVVKPALHMWLIFGVRGQFDL